MSSEVFLPIAAAAVTLAAVHALAPDHWMPLAALARAQNWTAPRTARIAAACGFAHVTVSVFVGLLGLALGVRIFDRFGAQLESVAGFVLIAFGAVYAIWGLRHARAHLHGHRHPHYDHIHDAHRVSPWMVFLLFAADPCLAIFPLMFAALPLGRSAVGVVILLYEFATIASIMSLVLSARAAATAVVKGRFVHRWGDALAGAFIAFVGVAVAFLRL
jgi:nickel/cobalt transporter (NicO) family protein